MEKTGINKKRRKYDESFKMELLKMVKSGRSVAEVSRTMGIGENLLYNRTADAVAFGRKWSRKASGIRDKYRD